ncbi:hypothetical protein ZIOFF_017900 [Zingiber officinale]|uniref:Uncharacterized protein n=1 Tax=Zingiber officinale TaxID=94328 RepID=A0A8J5H5Q1_ZINOF|nr:hypothetical protein ZIOFF_017900 [Zingiber officinale]
MVVAMPAIPSYRHHCASTIESLFLCRHLGSGHEERSLHPIADKTPPLPPSSPSASVAAFAVPSSKTTPLWRRCRSKVQVRLNAVATFIGIVGLTIAAGVLVVLLVWYPSGSVINRFYRYSSESALSHEPPVSFTASIGFSVANIHNGFEPVQ